MIVAGKYSIVKVTGTWLVKKHGIAIDYFNSLGEAINYVLMGRSYE